MAIYSCNLKSIGRSTHAPGTAGAHIRYISRPEAEPTLLAQHMPLDHHEARNWIDGAERAMRKNGRVVDKIRIALPRELTEEQRAELVSAFMAELTGERVPWFAAIHQRGSDAHNPHVHIAVHDRDVSTGKRALRLSDSARDRTRAGLPGPQAVEWIRERWESVCNEALARAGHAVRIDRRTLIAQGVDRKPGIHEGPRAQHIEGQVRRPESRERINGCGRLIDYPSIDHGRTRREFNAYIIDINLQQVARSQNPVTAAWAQYEKDERARDQHLEVKLVEEERLRTSALRSASQLHLDQIRTLREQRARALTAAAAKMRARFIPQREAMRKAQEQERAALKDRQSRLHIRLLRILDITGITRRRQETMRKVMARRHQRARKALSEQYRTAKWFAAHAVKAQNDALISSAQARRLSALAALKAQHAQEEQSAEMQRQQREIEREHARQITEAKIEAWRKTSGAHEPIGKASDFAAALRKAAGQEAERGSGRSRDEDGGRER